MLRQCAWCRTVLGQTAPADDRAVTHGICPTCSARLIDEARTAARARSATQGDTPPASAPARS